MEYRMTSGFLLFQWTPLPENKVYLRRKEVGLERKLNNFSWIMLNEGPCRILGSKEDDLGGNQYLGDNLSHT